MNRHRILLIIAGFCLAIPAAARGQIGMLDPQTQFAIIRGPETPGHHPELLAIVLWRGPFGWNQPRADERARADSIFRWARLRADEARQSIFGSDLWYGILDQGNQAVTIEGKRFPLAAGDSAPVIMVAVAPDNLPRVVTTASIAAALPDEFWPKHWQSGDTSFFVQPQFPRQQAMIHDALVRSPTVASFLEASPATSPQSPDKHDVLVPVSPGRRMTLAEIQPDLPAVEGAFECTGSEPIGQSAIGQRVLGADAVMFDAAFPSHTDIKATATVFIDSTGQIIRYVERRGPPIRPDVPPGLESRATPAQIAAADAAVRSTVITLDYHTGNGGVRNHGGGLPDQSASGPVDLVGALEKFGKARARAERVLAQCRTTK